MAWLVRDGDVLATAEVATTRRARRRGLTGRTTIEGAFVIDPCRHVHTFGMHVPIDVAFCDATGTVLHVVTLPPRRVSRFVRRARFVVEAAEGSFDRWTLVPGDVVEVKG